MSIFSHIKQLALFALTHAGIGVNRWVINRTDSMSGSVWICGDGRSGTTWLARIVNFDNRYRFLFEPLHPVLGLVKRAEIGFRYMRPDEDDPAWSRLLADVFLGRKSSRFVEMYNKKFFYRNVLVKDIFSHLHIRWVHEKFPQVKKVIIIRNPFSVALSKNRLRHWIWFTEPKRFLEDETLMQDYLRPFEDLIRRQWTYIEGQVLIWSVIHFVLFNQCKNCGIHFVFYEHLCSDATETARGLFEFLYGAALSTSTSDALASIFRTPSETSVSMHSLGISDNPTCTLSQQERDNCDFILRRFGLGALYFDDGRPDCDALVRLTS